MSKQILSLVGTSGAGKSTLLQALIDVLGLDGFLLPQITTRSPRQDDASETFRYVTDNVFAQTSFFCHSDRYGIAQDDLDTFLACKQSSIAVCINGAYETEQLFKKTGDFIVTPILVTYSDTLEEELTAIDTNMKQLFSGKRCQDRITTFNQLAEKYFFQPDFVSQVGLHLNRTQTSDFWCQNILNIVQSNIQMDKVNVLSMFKETMLNLIERGRGVSSYAPNEAPASFPK